MADQVKNVYVGASKLSAALAAAGAKGLRARMFVAKDASSKEAFGGYIELSPAPSETEGATVVGLHAYKTNAKGEALTDKNGAPYMSLVVGNRDDSVRGAIFSNTKRPEKRDADFRVVINASATETIDGKLWVSVPKTNPEGQKYLSGSIGSHVEAETPPADAAPTPAAPSTDPFGL